MINKRLIALILLSSLVFLYGCSQNPQPTPKTEAPPQKVEFSLSKDSIDIYDRVPSDKITVTIVQKDVNITPTTYDIRLISPREESLYFWDKEEDEKIIQIKTQEFDHVEDRKLYEFRVKGEKIEGLDYDPYTLRIELHHNNKSIAKRELKVMVR